MNDTSDELESFSELLNGTIVDLSEEVKLLRKRKALSESTKLKAKAIAMLQGLKDERQLISLKEECNYNLSDQKEVDSRANMRNNEDLKKLRYEILLSKQLANLDLRLSSRLENLRNEIYFSKNEARDLLSSEKRVECVDESYMIEREIQLTEYLKQIIIDNHIIDIQMELKLINILLNNMMENQGFMKTSDLMKSINFNDFIADSYSNNNYKDIKNITPAVFANTSIHPFLLKLLKFGVVQERENFKYVKMRNFGIE